ncbi:type III pantothenate kinase [Thiobacillus thioparus]|uniref:type III pantothenate kinase n=1 Tax=Thiobacillus thioparus TaxID=931 RepID=UPI00035DDF93|nr:type III pantothenate kinase [Thiobacillus thioparus]
MSGRRILLDAGNTRLKWAVVEDGHWHATGRSDYSDWSALTAQLKADTHCFVASVASLEHERQLAALLEVAGLTPAWLRAETRFGDVKNTYSNPHQLGADRWMGLIAARQRTDEAVLVVSVGTAMTVDALSVDGTFLGGVIVPGVHLMQQALRQGTSRIDEVVGAWQAFPNATAPAVQSGIVAALCGAIAQQHARLAEVAGMVPRCLLTGGDAEKVLSHLRISAEHVPELVLEGIDCVARGTAAS